MLLLELRGVGFILVVMVEALNPACSCDFALRVIDFSVNAIQSLECTGVPCEHGSTGDTASVSAPFGPLSQGAALRTQCLFSLLPAAP